MRILFLADAQSSHTRKWILNLSEKGFDIHLFSLHNPPADWYNSNINVYSFGLEMKIKDLSEKSIRKAVYFKAIKKIKEIIKNVKPDLLHSHYASSYGFLGSMTNFHPYYISVWGSDIESFPYKSAFHKLLIRYALKKADKIMSASKYLADRTKELMQKEIDIIPFGVDIKKFRLIESKDPIRKNEIIIGTIKSLEDNYGIDLLIKAFTLVKNKIPTVPLKLLIVGKGTRERDLKELAASLLNSDDYFFTGYIDHDTISEYHNKIDIPVYLSRKESFGVSILESMACRKPVIASNVGGLKEIIKDGINGLLAETENILSAAEAIEKLVLNPGLRSELGNNGMETVYNNYNWKTNLNQMISIYRGLGNGN